MTVTIEELQSHIDKEVKLTLTQEDGPSKVVTGKIKAATVAGVPFKEKGKAGLNLLLASQIESVSLEVEKSKSVSQKKLKPIIDGGMRQHLADRHGISLKWCRDATEEAARLFHDGDQTVENPGLDHADLGHKHVVSEKPAESAPETERQEALQS